MPVDLDLMVTTLLGTVFIGHHLGGQLHAHFHLARTWRLTKHNTTHDGLTFHHHFQFKFVSTTWAEDGYFKSPHRPNVGGDI